MDSGHSADFFETHDAMRSLFEVDWAVASRSHGLAWFIVKTSHDPSLWRDLDRGAEYEEVAAGVNMRREYEEVAAGAAVSGAPILSRSGLTQPEPPNPVTLTQVLLPLVEGLNQAYAYA